MNDDASGYRADPTTGPRYGPDSPTRRAGTHRLSTAHLVMGVLFLSLAGAWALAAAGVVSGDDLRWLLPLPFVLGGAAGLAALALAAQGRGRASAPR